MFALVDVIVRTIKKPTHTMLTAFACCVRNTQRSLARLLRGVVAVRQRSRVQHVVPRHRPPGAVAARLVLVHGPPLRASFVAGRGSTAFVRKQSVTVPACGAVTDIMVAIINVLCQTTLTCLHVSPLLPQLIKFMLVLLQYLKPVDCVNCTCTCVVISVGRTVPVAVIRTSCVDTARLVAQHTCNT